MYQFDEEDQEFTSEEADESAEEVLEELEETEESDPVNVSTKAKARIEEANLWNLLISHTFFTPGSAKPETIASVNRKIVSFATRELEILLGMRNREEKPVVAASEFSTEEAQVLRMLIAKVLKRDVPATPAIAPVEKKPELAPIAVPQPKIQQIQAPNQPRQQVKKSAPKPQEEAPAPQQKKKLRTKTDKGFATPNAKTKVKPMPTADQLLAQGAFVTPNISITQAKGSTQNDAMRSQSLLGQVVKSLTGGGHSIAVDDSKPADIVNEAGGDVNERF